MLCCVYDASGKLVVLVYNTEFTQPVVTGIYAVAIVVSEDAITGHVTRDISKLCHYYFGMVALNNKMICLLKKAYLTTVLCPLHSPCSTVFCQLVVTGTLLPLWLVKMPSQDMFQEKARSLAIIF